ncbi:MAG: aspartate kinase, partial [Candidatus Bathyarchaeia archaeon]
MKIVMKFGGASISSGEDLIKALNIVKDHLSRDDQVIIIASAFDNITDALQDAAEKASRGEGDAMEARLREIESRHIAIIENAIIFDESLRREASERLGNQIRELETILRGVMSIRELSCRSRDYILSFGERFAAPIMADALADSSLRARCFEGGEAGIVTDDSFGEARPLIELTRYEVQKRLSALERGTIPVIAGFIARTQDGSVTTLGRGGSDLTATLVGRSVGADEVWLWSNVDGLMTADPEIVPDARPLGSVTFLEAQEMAYFGARVIHPMALEPAREGGIKVRIKNLHNPSQAGTVIGGWLTSETAGVVRSLALIRDVALLTVSGAGMAGAPGVAARVFSALGSERINVLMISQGSSAASMSVVIPTGGLRDAL